MDLAHQRGSTSSSRNLPEGVEYECRRSGVWIKNDPPHRSADVYVFCLHKSLPATNENVADPGTWAFWVVATETLDDDLGGQKTLGLKRLDSLASRVKWSEIRQAVDRAIKAPGGKGER